MKHLFVINPAAGSYNRTDEYSQIIHKICGMRMNLMRIGDKLTAALGERDGVIDALKQKAGKLLLQLLDLERNGGLRIIQLLSSFGKATKLGYVYKSDQISELHISLLIIDNFDGNDQNHSLD